MPHPLFEDKENVELGAQAESPQKADPQEKKGFWSSWRHAFASTRNEGEYTENDILMIEKVAAAVVNRQMAVPALLFLESIKPVAFLGSQVLIFLRPFIITAVYGQSSNYERFALLMERREGVEKLIEEIEKQENQRNSNIRSEKESPSGK
jgi:hypothetical protein